MLGAILGDIVGSPYECKQIKTKEFELFTANSHFTDDSVLTVAIADALLHQLPYGETLKAYGRCYPDAGYGSTFRRWMQSDSLEPYNSWGNGSAMRVSPVAYGFYHFEQVLAEAAQTAQVTHNHPEGIKGAQAIALGIFLAREGHNKPGIREAIENLLGYDLSMNYQELPPSDVSCVGSVPHGLIAFLQSTSFEDAIRNAVFIGGDTDTIACMAGALAEAFYGIPAALKPLALGYLDEDLRSMVEKFQDQFMNPYR